MSPVRLNLTVAVARFPRVSGDEPLEETARRYLAAFSPREWG